MMSPELFRCILRDLGIDRIRHGNLHSRFTGIPDEIYEAAVLRR